MFTVPVVIATPAAPEDKSTEPPYDVVPPPDAVAERAPVVMAPGLEMEIEPAILSAPVALVVMVEVGLFMVPEEPME